MKIAAAPISWGVCEVPGWGCQLSPERVLAEAQALGFSAIEAGPPDFLPADPRAASDLLASYGLRLVAGFATAVLHQPACITGELAALTDRARWLSRAGAEVLVLAATTGGEGYERGAELSASEWPALFAALKGAEEIVSVHGLTLTLHPHAGTVIERPTDIHRFLNGCVTSICLDTGHLMLGGSDPLEMTRLAAPRVAHVHLKDVSQELSDRVRAGQLGYAEAVRAGLFRPLGKGDACIRQVIDLLEQAHYDGWYVLEQDLRLDSDSARPIDDIRASLTFAYA